MPKLSSEEIAWLRNECGSTAAMFPQKTMLAVLDHITALEAEIKTLREERDAAKVDADDLQRTFDLQWKADQRAIKRWRVAHPGNDNVWPDRANMVVWLMEQMGAPLTRPPTDEEVGKAIGRLTEYVSKENAERRPFCVEIMTEAADLIRRLSHQVSEARETALEEAAQLCEAVRDARFNDLPHYDTEPDFSTEDVCSETVCAWHIRAALKSSDETKK